MDLGNPKSPYGSVHPTDKTDVGNRLALAGLDVGYGRLVVVKFARFDVDGYSVCFVDRYSVCFVDGYSVSFVL